jgi:hypothetical protein
MIVPLARFVALGVFVRPHFYRVSLQEVLIILHVNSRVKVHGRGLWRQPCQVDYSLRLVRAATRSALTRVVAVRRSNPNGEWVKAYAGAMNYSSQHLTHLRQEITDLQNMNVLYFQRGAHSPVEKTASEGRANRLLEIKQELTKMRERPNDPAVWWGKFRQSNRSA